jgi:hypothetical protein
VKDWKLPSRLIGFLCKRIREMSLDDVDDPRSDRGKRWRLTTILGTVIAGIVSGQKSLRETEFMTRELSPSIRKLLGIKKRVPDTTVRDCLVRISPSDLRKRLHQTAHDAFRRKALQPFGLPCGVVAMDGKWSIARIADETYTQHHSESVSGQPIEQLRTVTSTLTSSKVKICLDAFPIPPETNEKGVFMSAFDAMTSEFSSHFEIVTYDAGANSEANARYVHEKGYGYVFALKADQGTLFEEVMRLLGGLGIEEATAATRDYIGGGKTVIRRLWKTTEIAGYHEWSHLKMVVRVQAVVLNEATGGYDSIEDRYFITNVHVGRFKKDDQWLRVIRGHWNVENNCHNTFDRIFREDDRVWIHEPQGMLNVQILRRIAYNLMALFRGVTQRSDEKREMPWKDLMREFYLAFIRFTAPDSASSRVSAASR